MDKVDVERYGLPKSNVNVNEAVLAVVIHIENYNSEMSEKVITSITTGTSDIQKPKFKKASNASNKTELGKKVKFSTEIPGGVTGFKEQEDGTYIDSSNNEWVWIEVPTSVTASATTDGEIESALRAYCSADDFIIESTSSAGTNGKNQTYGYTDTWYDGCGLEPDEYTQTKSKMLKSIKTNGGFYIGKYETGYEGSTIRGNKSDALTQIAVIKPDAYPYNYVTCAQAVGLAKNMPKPSGKTTSLLFGIQWDLVLKYIKENGGKTVAELTNNSTTWGNYNNNNDTNGTFNITSSKARNSTVDPYSSWNEYITKGTKKEGKMLLTTGSSTALSTLGIYDLAGNVWEWTLEKTSISSSPCARRGGSFVNNGAGIPVSYRNYGDTSNSFYDVGFRVSLY